MRHRADQPPGSVTRQLRIRVESDDILDVWQCTQMADDFRIAMPVAGAQKAIEVRQLAAFAFIAHPDLLLLVPSPWPMEQIENAGPVAFVFFIQRFYASACTAEQ